MTHRPARPQVIHAQRHSTRTALLQAASITSLVLILAGAVGSVALQSSLNSSSTDNRSQAAGTTTTIAACNETCSSNAQCAPDHFCYTGKCRHALNPESQICSSTPPVASPSPDTTKGGTTTGSTTASSSATAPEATTSTQTATSSATPSAATIQRVFPSPTAQPSTAPVTTTESDAGMLQNILGAFANPTSSLPVLLLISGLGLLVVLAVVGSILWLLGRRSSSPTLPTDLEKQPQTNITAAPAASKPAQDTTQESVSSAPPPRTLGQSPQPSMSSAPAPSPSVAPKPSQPAAAKPAPAPRPTDSPTDQERKLAERIAELRKEAATPQSQPLIRPAAQSGDVPPAPRSSMVERIRNKGITPPQGSDT